MVDGNAKVEATFRIEVDDVVRAIRGFIVSDVRERAAISHGGKPWSGCLVQSEELAHADAVEAVTLGDAVSP